MVIITSTNITLAKARPYNFHIVMHSQRNRKKQLEQILDTQKEEINMEQLPIEKMGWQERDSVLL